MRKTIYKKVIEKLKELVSEWGLGKVYLVGGCVRDELLGITPKDIDLVVDYPEGSDLFIDFLKTKHSDICSGFTVFPRFGTSRFTLNIDEVGSFEIECVIPRKESYEGCTRKPNRVEFASIKEDAERRDFCCNALYRNIITDKLLDPTGRGLEDIRNKILQTPLDPKTTFRDDPLRMLRAIRFSVCKGFNISSEVLKNISPIPEYFTLSMERIRDEFDKILLSYDPIKGINLLKECSLLEYIITPLNSYNGDRLLEVHKQTNSLELHWAALLPADIRIADKILRRLKYSNDFIEHVKFFIENHECLRYFYNPETKEYTGKPKDTRRIALKLGDLLKPTLILIEAFNNVDYKIPGQVESFKKHYEDEVVKYLPKNLSLKQPITGDEIIKHFNINPGKLIGEIKDVFQMWYNEDCSIDLFKKYEEYFKDKYIYVNEFGARITEEYSIPYKTSLEPGKYNAFEYPKFYIKLVEFKKACSIVNNIGKELEKFSEISDFKEVIITYDSYNDLTATIKIGNNEICLM